jgi:DNA-binding LacI/PurR family transcriptional regulator
MLAKHLLELGHREICEISGPLNWYGAKSRQAGLRETLSGVGVSLVASSEGDWTPLCGYDGTRRLLDSGARFTALVAGNDHTALGAMRALREHGLDVPRDVSVVGFDNIPETAYYEPPLTTVHQDFEALGSQSVEYRSISSAAPKPLYISACSTPILSNGRARAGCANPSRRSMQHSG